jgi:hypothetical protein
VVNVVAYFYLIASTGNKLITLSGGKMVNKN